MALDGPGVGSVYAVNPLQITGGVPAAETGSAISFYQLVRTVAYALASTLSATVLVESPPAGPGPRPTRLRRRRSGLHGRPGRRAAASSLFLILVRGTGVRMRLDILPRLRAVDSTYYADWSSR